MASASSRKRVLLLGGGDGLAVRELLRYPEVEKITLVDLDPAVTEMATTVASVSALNEASLLDTRVELVHDDAMVWLDQHRPEPYDVVLVDFPDPNNFSLGKLYTRRFYQLVQEVMSEGAMLAVQSTSPLFARRSYWCVERSMRAAGLHTAPFHVPVPSFGEWGYVLASSAPFAPPQHLVVDGLRYLNDVILPTLFVFPADMGPVEGEVNRLNRQILVQYYDAEWAAFN